MFQIEGFKCPCNVHRSTHVGRLKGVVNDISYLTLQSKCMKMLSYTVSTTYSSLSFSIRFKLRYTWSGEIRIWVSPCNALGSTVRAPSWCSVQNELQFLHYGDRWAKGVMRRPLVEAPAFVLFGISGTGARPDLSTWAEAIKGCCTLSSLCNVLLESFPASQGGLYTYTRVLSRLVTIRRCLSVRRCWTYWAKHRKVNLL